MTFTTLKSPTLGPPTSGFRLLLRITKRGDYVCLYISRHAQQRIFGGCVFDRRMTARIGRGTHEGEMVLEAADEGALTAKNAGAKGTARIDIERWDLLQKHPCKSESCRIIREEVDSVTLGLPDWACPGRRGITPGPE